MRLEQHDAGRKIRRDDDADAGVGDRLRAARASCCRPAGRADDEADAAPRERRRVGRSPSPASRNRSRRRRRPSARRRDRRRARRLRIDHAGDLAAVLRGASALDQLSHFAVADEQELTSHLHGADRVDPKTHEELFSIVYDRAFVHCASAWLAHVVRKTSRADASSHEARRRRAART